MADFRPASVPYNPTAEAMPTTSAPNDLLRVQATPEDFGAQVGKATEGLGQTLGQASADTFNTNVRIQQLQNESVVNGALTKWQQGNDSLLYDPPKLDANGQPVAGTGGFYSQRGNAAVAGYGSTVGTINKNYQDIRNSLTPRQQLMFDQLTRREMSYTLRSVGRHADEQGNVWQDQQTGAFLDTTSQSASLAAVNGHMDLFDEKINQGMSAAIHWGDLKGYGSEWGQSQAQEFVGKTVMNAAKQFIDSGQPQQAASLLQKYEGKMDKGSVLAVKGALKGDARAIDAQSAADHYLDQMGYGVTPQGSITDRIVQVESGGNPSAHAGTSSAEGLGQFITSTWNQFLKARHPNLIGHGDLRSDPALSREATQWYAQENSQKLQQAGFQPTGGNIYLAHFLGPDGAISMLSANPNSSAAALDPKAAADNRTIFYNPDGTPKTAGQLVEWASTKMGDVHGTKAQILADKANVIQDIRQKYANDPQMADAIISRVNAGLTTAMLTARSNQEAALAQQDQKLDEYLRPAMAGKDVSMLTQKLVGDNEVSGPLREKIYNALQTIGHGKAYGSDFYSVFQRVHSTGAGRITDPSQLLGLVDGSHLTLQGFEKLKTEMSSGKNIDGAATNDMIKHTLAYLKHQLTFSADYGTYKIPDPQGEDIFNTKAIPAFYKAYEEGIKAGKTPYQLLSKESPDFIGDKIVSTFKRTKQQEMKDQVAAGETAIHPAGGAKSPASYDLTSVNGVVAAYKGGSISYAEASAKLHAFGVRDETKPETVVPQPVANPDSNVGQIPTGE